MPKALTKTAPKRMGRPSKYQPKFCERILELGAQGMGVCEIAVEFGVVRQTVYSWKEQHPEFLDAFTRAREMCQAWWERQGREGLSSREFNHGLWKLNIVNRFPKDWSDRQKVEHSTPAKLNGKTLLELLEDAQESSKTPVA